MTRCLEKLMLEIYIRIQHRLEHTLLRLITNEQFASQFFLTYRNLPQRHVWRTKHSTAVLTRSWNAMLRFAKRRP